MKKTYITPSIYVKKVKINNILAGSPEIQTTGASSSPDDEGNGGGYVGGFDYGNGGNGLAKQGSGWSFDDSDE